MGGGTHQQEDQEIGLCQSSAWVSTSAGECNLFQRRLEAEVQGWRLYTFPRVRYSHQIGKDDVANLYVQIRRESALAMSNPGAAVRRTQSVHVHPPADGNGRSGIIGEQTHIQHGHSSVGQVKETEIVGGDSQV